jgi:hypothetical protein
MTEELQGSRLAAQTDNTSKDCPQLAIRISMFLEMLSLKFPPRDVTSSPIHYSRKRSSKKPGYGDSEAYLKSNTDDESGLLQSVETEEKQNGLRRGLKNAVRAGIRIQYMLGKRMMVMKLKGKDMVDEFWGRPAELKEEERVLTTWAHLKEERVKMRARVRGERMAEWEMKQRQQNLERDNGHVCKKLAKQDREIIPSGESKEADE